MNKAGVVLLLAICMLNMKCIAVKYYDYADIDKEVAVESIQKLKGDTLLIVVPTNRKKIQIIKNSSKSSRAERKKLKQQLIVLYAQRLVQQEALINSFNEHYSFSPVLYIPDSLVYQFESGQKGNYFLNESLRIDSTLSFSNTSPIKLIQQFDQVWHIKIKNKIIPNPFPNYYIYRNGLFVFLGEETFDEMYDRVASTFQRRFEMFYDNPDRRVYF